MTPLFPLPPTPYNNNNNITIHIYIYIYIENKLSVIHLGNVLLYVPEDFHQIWKEFKQICDREDSSRSKKIRGMVARYVAVHTEGNPQTLLASYSKPTIKICWKCRGKFPNLIHVKFISGLSTRICSTCKEEYDKRQLIKKVLGAR